MTAPLASSLLRSMELLPQAGTGFRLGATAYLPWRGRVFWKVAVWGG